MKKKIPIYPTWICHPCGVKHGNRTVGMATWHKNTCDICGAETSVTEPRDYGHLKDTWIKAAEKHQPEQTMKTDTPRTDIDTICDAIASKLNDAFNLYAWDDSKTHAKKIVMDGIYTTITRFETELAAARQEIKDLHKAYGFELRDPNGTIWEYAAKMKEGITAARAELTAVTEQRDRLAEALRECLERLEHHTEFGALVQADMSAMHSSREALQSLTTNSPDQERKSPASNGSI